MPIAPSGSLSSDYFSDDSMELADALEDRVLPGDVGWNSQGSQNEGTGEDTTSVVPATRTPLPQPVNAHVQQQHRQTAPPVPQAKPPMNVHSNTRKTIIYDIPDPMYLRELPTGDPNRPPSLKRPRPEDFDEDLPRSTNLTKTTPSGTGRFEDGDMLVDDVNPPNPAAEGVRMIQGGTGRYGFKHSENGKKLDVYGASKFGGFGDYMARKRAKLQIQNAQISRETQDGKATQDTSTPGSPAKPSEKIFRGIAIYVNGWTKPSIQELRKMIVEHGGVFQPYLDKKSIVTHVIATSLTPAKVKEFQHMNVARPDWIVKSIESGKLLPWTDYAFNTSALADGSKGESRRRVAQTSLLSSFPTTQSKHTQSSAPSPSGPANTSAVTPVPRPKSPTPAVASSSKTPRVAPNFIGKGSAAQSASTSKSDPQPRPEPVKPAVARADSSNSKSGVRLIDFVQLAQAKSAVASSRSSRSPPVNALRPPSKPTRSKTPLGPYPSKSRSPSPFIGTPTTTVGAVDLKSIPALRSGLARLPQPMASSSKTTLEMMDPVTGTALAPGVYEPPPLAQRPKSHIFESDYSADVQDDESDIFMEPSGPALEDEIEQTKSDLPAAENDSSKLSRVPYAAHASNPHAQRAMASSSWRTAHTSAAGSQFIKSFYANSRLHHLSTWRTELQGLVRDAQEKAEERPWEGVGVDEVKDVMIREKMDREMREMRQGPLVGVGLSMLGAVLPVPMSPSSKSKGKHKARAGTALVEREKVIMHCDFDCFFVAAGLVTRPHLKGRPVVVCHSQGGQGGVASTSEIASCSYEARKKGVKNGMSLQQAKQLCPEIITIPYEFEQYKRFSLLFYTVLMRHADELQAVSVDEALIDVTSGVKRIEKVVAENFDESDPEVQANVHPAKRLAEVIRNDVRDATHCEISIGVSYNILLARLATRRAKPAGSFHILPEGVPDIISTLNIRDLHGFGYATAQKAEEKLGSTALSDLALKSRGVLCEALGKSTGETLYNVIRGVDGTKIESCKERKSVSCDITYGIRFERQEQVEEFVFSMANEVSRRLRCVNSCAKAMILKVMARDPDAPVEGPKFMGHGMCTTYNKQGPLIGAGGKATDDPKVIGEHSWRMMDSFHFDPKELRGIGIHVTKLEPSSGVTPSETGQATLNFQMYRSTHASKAADPKPPLGPPRSWIFETLPFGSKLKPQVPVAPDEKLQIPSFSQIDPKVMLALPPDIQLEIQAEYKRQRAEAELAAKNAAAEAPARGRTGGNYNNRFKGVAKQLGVRGSSNVGALQTTLFAKKKSIFAPGRTLNISEATLRELGLEPEVFFALPVAVQREQLSLARYVKANNTTAETLITTMDQKKVVIKNRKSKKVYPKLPHPKAVYPEPPTMKHKASKKDEPALLLTDTDDFQEAIGSWVDKFQKNKPKENDIRYFKRFLVACITGPNQDSARVPVENMQKAVVVMKWWSVLLRRHFRNEEDMEELDCCDTRPEVEKRMKVGVAWWTVFREVKQELDELVRKKWGGRLSIR